MRTLGHVVKIQNRFAFYLLFIMRTTGRMMAHRSHSKLKTELKIKCYVLTAHRSHSKLETELKIKCIFMAHRSHSKSKTRMKIKCLI